MYKHVHPFTSIYNHVHQGLCQNMYVLSDCLALAVALAVALAAALCAVMQRDPA